MKFSYIFTLGLTMSLTMSIQTFAAATSTQPTRETAVEWAKSKIGTAIDYDGAYGAQCVDLIKGYSNELWNYYSLRGNAGEYVSNNSFGEKGRTESGRGEKMPPRERCHLSRQFSKNKKRETQNESPPNESI